MSCSGASQPALESLSSYAGPFSGLLPPFDLDWPRDATFRAALHAGMARLDMARFTLRHPRLVDTLLANVLSALCRFEQGCVELDGEHDGGGGSGEGLAGASDAASDNGTGVETGERPNADESSSVIHGQVGADSGEHSESAEALRRAEERVGALRVELSPHRSAEDGRAAAAAELAARIVDTLAADWQPLTEKLELAAAAFPDFDVADLIGEIDLESGGRIDASRAVWHASGWRELASLRAKLAKLRSLRDLVRSLGRSSGLKPPLGRAPRLIAARQRETPPPLPGALLSVAAPNETRGLNRSGDLGRILPSESALLAAATALRRPSLRRLFSSRRVERTLLSYERSGWALEAVQLPQAGGMEMRPRGESGPILLCLDTSGSMAGARETVAKALALECLRQARQQGRACTLFAFSGPGDCLELPLAPPPGGAGRQRRSLHLGQLLQFLGGSFHGGTDVEEPLRRCLCRISERAWSQADILLVTDGELPLPEPGLLAQLSDLRLRQGLNVHGLLVGTPSTGCEATLRTLCADRLTIFSSWAAVA